MPILNVPNEAALARVLIGTETVPGTAVVPDGRLLLDFSAQPGIGAIRRSLDATGTYDRTATVRRERAFASGTGPAGGLTFQELAILAQYFIKGGVSGVSDSESTPGYTYTYAPSATSDDIATFTANFGVDGLPWFATGVRYDEVNISGDATSNDDQWQISGTPFITDAGRLETGDIEFTATGGSTTTAELTDAAWTPDELIGQYIFQDYGTHIGEVRQISDNDEDSVTVSDAFSSAVEAGDVLYISAAFPTVADADYDPIPMEGTSVYLDEYNASSSSIGTTLISDRVLSFNVNQTLSRSRKNRASGTIGRTGRGARVVSGTLRLEDDRWDEYMNLINDTELSLRIEQTGPAIDADAGTNHLARIDIERLVFDTRNPDVDENNMTASYPFVALLEAPIWQIVAKTNLATLP